MKICHLRDIFNITAMDNYDSYLTFFQTELLKQALFLSNGQCLTPAIKKNFSSFCVFDNVRYAGHYCSHFLSMSKAVAKAVPRILSSYSSYSKETSHKKN